MKINRRKFFNNMLALSAVTYVKPSDFVTFQNGQPLYHDFQAMSGTSMKLPYASSRIIILAQLRRFDLIKELINELQLRNGTSIEIEDHQWGSNRG